MHGNFLLSEIGTIIVIHLTRVSIIHNLRPWELHPTRGIHTHGTLVLHLIGILLSPALPPANHITVTPVGLPLLLVIDIEPASLHQRFAWITPEDRRTNLPGVDEPMTSNLNGILTGLHSLVHKYN